MPTARAKCGRVIAELRVTMRGMKHFELADQLTCAGDRLTHMGADIAAGKQVERQEFSEVVASIRRAELALFGPRKPARHGEGAIPLLRDYFIEHVGEPIPGEVLREISGIQEWARRVRELRVQHGYEITELGGSQYRLENITPNSERANQWKLANGIRRQGGSAIGRIEEFLIQTVGEVVDREQIDYVSRIKEGSRRIRELRDEHGWPINSHIDEPDLQPGQYRLVSASVEDRRDTSQRLYPEGLRHKVFERDGFTCQSCARDRHAAEAVGDTRFYLEVHHKSALANELSDLPPDELNTMANLVTLCHSCHRQETGKLQERKRKTRRAN